MSLACSYTLLAHTNTPQKVLEYILLYTFLFTTLYKIAHFTCRVIMCFRLHQIKLDSIKMIRSSTNFEMNWESKCKWVSLTSMWVCFLDVFFEMIGWLAVLRPKPLRFLHYSSPHKLTRSRYVSNFLRMIIEINYKDTYIFITHTTTQISTMTMLAFFIFHLLFWSRSFVCFFFCVAFFANVYFVSFYLFIYSFCLSLYSLHAIVIVEFIYVNKWKLTYPYEKCLWLSW